MDMYIVDLSTPYSWLGYWSFGLLLIGLFLRWGRLEAKERYAIHERQREREGISPDKKEYLGTIADVPKALGPGGPAGIVTVRIYVDEEYSEPLWGEDRGRYWGQISAHEVERLGLKPGVRVRLVPTEALGAHGDRSRVYYVLPAA